MLLARNLQPKIFIQQLIKAKKAYAKPGRPGDQHYDINEDGTGGDDVYYTDDPEFISNIRGAIKLAIHLSYYTGVVRVLGQNVPIPIAGNKFLIQFCNGYDKCIDNTMVKADNRFVVSAIYLYKSSYKPRVTTKRSRSHY